MRVPRFVRLMFAATFFAAPAHAQAALSGVRGIPLAKPLVAGEIDLEIRATDTDRGVPHALICIRELEPTRLNDWVVADSAGRIVVLNLPVTELHLWIDHVGFAPESLVVSDRGLRDQRLLVHLTPRADARSEPSCRRG